MFSRITSEFEQIEFAEFAAKRIRETVNGTKRITIFQNQSKYKGHLQNHEKKTKKQKGCRKYDFVTVKV